MGSTRKPYGPPYQTRIEPDLGVPVLTHIGYLAREADRKGTSIQEEMEDEGRLLHEMEVDFLADWGQPDKVLAAAQEFIDICNAEERKHYERFRVSHPGIDKPTYIARPRRIIQILDVEGGCGFRGHKVTVRALAIREHGRRDVLCLMDAYEHGMSYYDPPESEQDVWWESEQKEIQ